MKLFYTDRKAAAFLIPIWTLKWNFCQFELNWDLKISLDVNSLLHIVLIILLVFIQLLSRVLFLVSVGR